MSNAFNMKRDRTGEEEGNGNGNGRSHKHKEHSRFQTVNLDQFRNNEVGKGYQARGVIRQNTGLASMSNMKVIDMTKKPAEKQSTGIHEHDDDRRESKRRRGNKTQKKSTASLCVVDEYLRNKPLRDFRKELQKILSEAQKLK